MKWRDSAMTAPRSTGDLRRYLGYRLYSLRGTLFVIIVLALLSYPLLGLASNGLYTIRQMRYDGPPAGIAASEYYSRTALLEAFVRVLQIAGPIALTLMFVFGTYTAIKSFRYLIDRNETDVMMSLPLDHKRRFFGDLT
ncbi:MAG: hypothetical protein J6X60_07395, partial [Ruminiclostridium sp.]|nr:hypothetical protein [Ruminiclostridium sp.]